VEAEVLKLWAAYSQVFKNNPSVAQENNIKVKVKSKHLQVSVVSSVAVFVSSQV